MEHSNEESLSILCERLGAEPGRARQMAGQLLKRSKQLALERQISEAEALEHLLGLLISAREGGGRRQSASDQA